MSEQNIANAITDPSVATAVRLVLAKRLRQRHDIDDAMQTVFMKAIAAAHQFDQSRGRLIDWIIGITKLVAIDVLRKRKRNALQYDLCAKGRANKSRPDIEPAEIEAAIRLVPHQFREVVWLHFARGLSMQEVAVCVGQPIGTVKSSISRGLRYATEWVKEAA